jgi:hypothetical protein
MSSSFVWFNILREEKKSSGLSNFGGVCLSILVKYIAFVVEKANIKGRGGN